MTLKLIQNVGWRSQEVHWLVGVFLPLSYYSHPTLPPTCMSQGENDQIMKFNYYNTFRWRTTTTGTLIELGSKKKKYINKRL